MVENILHKISTVPSKYIYLLVIMAQVIPLFFAVKIPLTPTQLTIDAFNLIENLKPGDYVWALAGGSYMQYPLPIKAQESALCTHLFRQEGIKIVFYSGSIDGAFILVNDLKDVPKYGKEYGVDYVILFVYGGETTMASFLQDIHALVTVDYYGNSIDDLQMMRGINSFRDFALCTNSGLQFENALHVWYPLTKKMMWGTCSSTWAPSYYPYWKSGQCAFLNDIGGCAEYELLLNAPGLGMGAQFMLVTTHGLFIILVIAGNIIFFGEWYIKRKKRKATTTQEVKG